MPIWTDALCTNQADDDEKSAQVDQMGRIYRRAACVYIFLQGDLPSAAPGSGLGGPFGGGFGGGFGGSPIGSSNGSDSGRRSSAFATLSDWRG
jgi:hypothetical protein